MKAKVRFSEADIPDIAAWRADPDIQDKYCPICYIDEMDLSEIITHLGGEHLVQLSSPLHEWQTAKEELGTDSEEEDEVKQTFEASSSSYNHPFTPGTARESESSQDSSSE